MVHHPNTPTSQQTTHHPKICPRSKGFNDRCPRLSPNQSSRDQPVEPLSILYPAGIKGSGGSRAGNVSQRTSPLWSSFSPPPSRSFLLEESGHLGARNRERAKGSAGKSGWLFELTEIRGAPLALICKGISGITLLRLAQLYSVLFSSFSLFLFLFLLLLRFFSSRLSSLGLQRAARRAKISLRRSRVIFK